MIGTPAGSRARPARTTTEPESDAHIAQSLQSLGSGPPKDATACNWEVRAPGEKTNATDRTRAS